jgi:hypothetical protein
MAKVGDNIKMRSYINVCEAVSLIHLAENVVQCCVLVNMVMRLWTPSESCSFLATRLYLSLGCNIFLFRTC